MLFAFVEWFGCLIVGSLGFVGLMYDLVGLVVVFVVGVCWYDCFVTVAYGLHLIVLICFIFCICWWLLVFGLLQLVCCFSGVLGLMLRNCLCCW